MDPRQLTRRLNRLCDSFRRRLRGLIARWGFCRVAIVAIVMFAVLSLVDWRLHFGPGVRLGLLVAYVATLATLAWAVLVRPIRGAWTNREVLAYLDSTAPSGRDMLLDAYELASTREAIEETETPAGSLLADQALSQLATLPDHVSLSAALDGRRANRALTGALAAIAVLTSVTLIAPEYVETAARRLFQPLASVRWPHRTTINVARPDTGWTVPQLESFTVVAAVTGEVPERVTLAYRTDESGGWIREKLPVRQESDQDSPATETAAGTVTYTFPEIRAPVDFYLEGGDYQTDLQQIAIIQRPFVTSITAHYTYPSYAGLPDRTVASGQLAGLEGTQVRLVCETSMPLDSAVMVLDQTPRGQAADAAQRIDLAKVGDTTYEHTLMLTGDGRYAIELYEPNGFREARPEVYEIRVTPDEPPQIEFTSPAADLVETNRATVEVAFTAHDRLGLAAVEFFYTVDDGEPQRLSDRITGPIAQSGPQSRGEFRWALRRLELPESGQLSYFVRVRDNNPTGRGLVESVSRRVQLVRPSEFHLDAIERAKLLEEEARIAWRNQLAAWQLAGKWLALESGADADPTWDEMHDAQQKSLVATQQIVFHLQTLTEKYQRNHMARDFMAGRLSVVSELLDRLMRDEHAAIDAALRNARPKTAADAAPARLKSLRSAALSSVHQRQKMAVLVLERMLRKLYDWRDLQTCLITSKLLHEQQDDVLVRTAELAPRSIAKEIEDLSDDDQEQLLTLGKQQRAIFDTESGLEQQINYLMYKAERQRRDTIRAPLQAAFKNLRGNRVNDHLKRAAEMIENNQPSQILDNQRAAMRALEVVHAGLLLAGSEVDPDEPLTLAMSPADEGQFDPDAVKPADVAKTDPTQTADTVASTDVTEVVLEPPALPEGTDAVSAALRLTIELEDNVLARTRYLHANRGPGEMPRFLKLKLLRLQERQQAANQALAAAIERAAGAEHEQVRSVAMQVAVEFAQAQQLLAAAVTDPTLQQIEADSLATLEDLLQLVALQQSTTEAVAENKRLGGVDAFARSYLLRDADLDAAVALVNVLAAARVQQADVRRKLVRFVAQPARGKLMAKIEIENRRRAAQAQRQIQEHLAATQSIATRISEPLRERVAQTGLGGLHGLKLESYAERIAAGNDDETTAADLESVLTAMTATVHALRDLLEERVRPPVAVAEAAPPKMTSEEFQKLTSREHLAARLRDEASLPPEIRQRMVRALEQEFPAKYRRLLQAYYGSFITTKDDSPGNVPEPDVPPAPDPARSDDAPTTPRM